MAMMSNRLSCEDLGAACEVMLEGLNSMLGIGEGQEKLEAEVCEALVVADLWGMVLGRKHGWEAPPSRGCCRPPACKVGNVWLARWCRLTPAMS